MTFILSEERDENVVSAFENYRLYLYSLKDKFPSSVYQLATSDWYFDFNDHRCPHDAWLTNLAISENQNSSDKRHLNIKIHLLGAYHDYNLIFEYLNVSKYSLKSFFEDCGPLDWRYDEFRLSDSGQVIHEIEWHGFQEEGHFIIEAEDVLFKAEKI